MTGWLLRVFSVLFLAAGAASAAIWNARGSLPYNDQGRFFDPETSVVLHDQSGAASGVTAIICLLLAIGAWLLSRRF